MIFSAVTHMACAAVVVAAGLLGPSTATTMADPNPDGPTASAATLLADGATAIDLTSSLPLLVAIVSAPIVSAPVVQATPDCFSCAEELG